MEQIGRLTDEGFERLGEWLARFGSEGMTTERVDGLFAALVCAPSMVPPSQYLGVILGEESPFESREEAQDALGLLMGHWNDVVARFTDEVFLPYLLDGDDGPAGEAWAQGFMLGMDMTRSDWTPLIEDEKEGGCLVPIMALAHLNDPDPELRPYEDPNIDEERHEKLLAGLTAGATLCHAYLEPARRAGAPAIGGSRGPYRRAVPKVGRNDPCPCRSGRKYKRCCLTKTSH